jgi:hypothetical protein
MVMGKNLFFPLERIWRNGIMSTHRKVLIPPVNSMPNENLRGFLSFKETKVESAYSFSRSNGRLLTSYLKPVQPPG